MSAVHEQGSEAAVSGPPSTGRAGWRRRAWIRRAAALAVAAALLAACTGDASESESAADPRYSVVVTGFDPDWKIRAIKAIRAETGLGLADAKRLVEADRGVARVGLTRAEADVVAARLREEGLRVELEAEP